MYSPIVMNIWFDVSLMKVDAVERGLTGTALAKKAKVSQMAVSRFLRGQSKSPTTAKKLANALGFEVRRYLRTDEARAS